MNQKTLQTIYKSYETEQFFKRYLVNLGCRQDRRKVNQHRQIKITSRNNSIVLSVNQTIIVTNVEVEMQSVTYSPVSQSYGQPLLRLKVTSNAFSKHHQNKSDRAIQEFIGRHINWAAIEDQLVGSDLHTGQQYDYKGNIHIRVLGDDGGAQQYALLAVQLLLWTCRFKKFTINKQKIQYGSQYKLQLHQFLFPFKYCRILDFTLVDPSLSEQENCDLIVSVIKNVKNMDNAPKMIYHSRKDKGKQNEQILKNILSEWQVESQQIAKQFETLLNSLENKKEYTIYQQKK